MARESRSKFVIKNTSVTLLMQVVKNLLGFVSRTVFIKILGSEYLGVNSLFTEILTMLSFAELGIGNAMVFSLYKPLAEEDKEKIKSLMRLYARCYQVIGITIAVLGICVIPFLNVIVGEVSYVKEDIALLYILFLLNSVLSYFFVYKKSLIIADQRNYIVEIYQQVFYAIQVVVQSVFLVLTKEFIPYLLVVIGCTFLNNFFVARKADKMYPYLKDKNVYKLEKSELKSIVENVKALVVYKVGGIILESTSSMFISSLINVVTVGLYANYKLIINIFKTIGSNVMNSIIASVGNLNAVASSEKKLSVFKEMFYINAWFFGFTAVGLCVFLTDFIGVWLGDGFAIGFDAVFAACVYYYVSNMHYPCLTYRTTAGLFVFGKYVPILASAISLIMSYVLGRAMGLAGILWASVLARTFSYEIIDPVIIYKRVFNKSSLRYFTMYALYLGLILVDGYISFLIINLIPLDGLTGFIFKAIILSVVYNLLFFLATIRTPEFQSLLSRVKYMVHGRKA